MPKLQPILEGRNVHPLFRQLDKARLAKGMSVAALSQASGYHLSQLRDWRNGRHSPSLNAIVDVAGALGYEVTLTPKGS